MFLLSILLSKSVESKTYKKRVGKTIVNRRREKYLFSSLFSFYRGVRGGCKQLCDNFLILCPNINNLAILSTSSFSSKSETIPTIIVTTYPHVNICHSSLINFSLNPVVPKVNFDFSKLN